MKNSGKPEKAGFIRLYNALIYSINGLKAAFKHEAAFRQETLLISIGSLMAIFLPITLVEQLLLIASLALVLIVELINSAIEAIVDRISTDMHELSGRAKDIGSAAVLITLALAALIWGSILLNIMF